MTRQLAGQSQESTWHPALAEIEDALAPAFIVEELDDHRFAVLRFIRPNAARRRVELHR